MSPKSAAVAREPGHRSRRTSSDVEDAILRATRDILHEVGFEELTIEAVAARSGAAKTAIYRRWPSKVPLVVEALTRPLPEPAVPDTGDLRNDMIALWVDVTGRGQGSIERLLPVVAAYLTTGDDLMAQLRERYFEPRLQAAYAMLHRAAARGEIRADVDPSWPSTCCSARWPTGGCAVLPRTRKPSAVWSAWRCRAWRHPGPDTCSAASLAPLGLIVLPGAGDHGPGAGRPGVCPNTTDLGARWLR